MMAGRQQQVRTALGRRMTRAVTAVGPCRDDDPRSAVAFLALDGCVLGWYAGVHPGDPAWWNRALGAVASYAALPVPPERAEAVSARWERFPMRDELPLLDAVLTLIQHGGVRSVTLERVARAAGRDVDWLASLYGTVDELLGDLQDRVASDGFDDLAPLHLEPSRAGVRSMLDVLTDDRRTTSLLRTLALSGVEVSHRAATAARELSPVARPGWERLDDDTWVAALAVDAWALGSSAWGPYAEQEMDGAVAAELQRLIGCGAS
jgi:hypothetical protein